MIIIPSLSKVCEPVSGKPSRVSTDSMLLKNNLLLPTDVTCHSQFRVKKSQMDVCVMTRLLYLVFNFLCALCDNTDRAKRIVEKIIGHVPTVPYECDFTQGL